MRFVRLQAVEPALRRKGVLYDDERTWSVCRQHAPLPRAPHIFPLLGYLSRVCCLFCVSLRAEITIAFSPRPSASITLIPSSPLSYERIRGGKYGDVITAPDGGDHPIPPSSADVNQHLSMSADPQPENQQFPRHFLPQARWPALFQSSRLRKVLDDLHGGKGKWRWVHGAASGVGWIHVYSCPLPPIFFLSASVVSSVFARFSFSLLPIPTCPNVRPKVRYPVVEASQEWDWQDRRWHIDGDTGRIDTHQSVVVLPMVTPISAGGGGTALLTGSHRTVARWLHDSVSQPLPSRVPLQPIPIHLIAPLPDRASGALVTTAESAPSSRRRLRPRGWGRSSRRRATPATCWYAHNILNCVAAHAHHDNVTYDRIVLCSSAEQQPHPPMCPI